MAQLFAATRDELSRRPTGADNRVLSAVRMAFTAGWVLGPVLGSWLGSVVGLRPLLVATAVLTLSQLLPLAGQRVERFRRPGQERSGAAALGAVGISIRGGFHANLPRGEQAQSAARSGGQRKTAIGKIPGDDLALRVDACAG